MRLSGARVSVALIALGGLGGCGNRVTPGLAGDGGGEASPPPCPAVATLQDLCWSGTCDETWEAVQTNHTYCGACSVVVYGVGDCGGYHVLGYGGTDFGGVYFFDAASGRLVGTTSVNNAGRSCASAPGVAFVPPTCAGDGMQLPGWCSPDAGAAGARAFPCCANTLDVCGRGTLCPATWQAVSSAVANYCQPYSQYTNPQIGECGSTHVLRYDDGLTPRTLYYDAASGALVAAVDSDSRCTYGPIEGVELPSCTPTFSSVCPDGGVDGG